MIYNAVTNLKYCLLKGKWKIAKKKKPDMDAVSFVRQNVTFIYKSFERQNLAKALFKNIQNYYPGVAVIIADDSKIPLEIESPYVRILHLPFNSGLSYGINRALEQVQTPYLVRLDDDELLTPYSDFHRQLQFLEEHSEVDLVGVLPYNLIGAKTLEKSIEEYYAQSMREAPCELKIPHMTKVDDTHVVVGKTPNIYIARTEKIRQVGFDDRIRMIDHNEFFYRAAGKLVSVLATDCFVLHRHDPLDSHYQQFRDDIQGDLLYIQHKQGMQVRDQHSDLTTRFLEALRLSLKGKSVDWERLSEAEWKELFRMASIQQMLPMVYEAVCLCPAAEKSQELLHIYQKKAMQEAAKQIMKTGDFLQVYKKLTDAGIRPLVLKGLICRELYLKPNHRPSTDEDIFVSMEDFYVAHKAMLAYGMHTENDVLESVPEVSYFKKGTYTYIEMHKQLFSEEDEVYGNYNRFFDGAHERADELTVQNTRIYTMCPTDHFLFLVCHAFKHFLSSGFGLRQICDLALFAKKYGEEIDWQWILDCCQQMQSLTLMAGVFDIARRYLGIDFNYGWFPEVWKDPEISGDELLDDILEGGVLGNSSMNRLHSSNITLHAVKSDKKGVTDKGYFRKIIFPSVNTLKDRYSYLERRPYLLPVAWVSRIVGYGRELKTSKGIAPRVSMEIGNRRVELMKRYGVIGRKE